MSAMSAIHQLDNSISLAVQALAELCEEFEAEVGRKPTIQEFAELLAYGIQRNAADLFEEVIVAVVTPLFVFVKPQVTGDGWHRHSCLCGNTYTRAC
jgi:hypothetical protein